MLKKLRKIISYKLRNRKLYKPYMLSGLSIKAIPGTVREKTDQDDAWFYALAQNSKYIFDIGCNIGYTGLLAAIQDNTKKILLVDPNPEALAIASQNLIINGFADKVLFYSAFVGEQIGEQVKFFTVGAGAAGSMFASHAETAASVNSFYYVSKVTIDELVKHVGFVPDFIKIDVEGAEA
jgi:FkbM family methyltransferase